ncbi:hypothetical protein BDQ17DRAFT_1346349 [Cyathus striatus]|nr:hypothetical protein BDQ17DRAFT_1346349 [Cyathus striatus]
MILLDELDQKPKHDSFSSPTLRHPQRAYARTASPLPDYDTSQAYQKLLTKPAARKRSNSKFWKAVLYAFLVYLILTIAIAVPLIVLKTRRASNVSWGSDYPNSLWASDNSNYPVPLPPSASVYMPLPTNLTCNAWVPPEHPSDTSSDLNTYSIKYSLPPTGLITIRSNVTTDIGDRTGTFRGNLSVNVSKSSNISDVTFDIQIQYSGTTLPPGTHVCFADKGSYRGVSIYLPEDFTHHTDFLTIDINVEFPKSTPPSSVDTFLTYLPSFSQTFGDLRKQRFDQVAIEGSGRDIECEFLRAPQITVKNLLASIKGTYNVTDTLTLDTLKGAINANITLAKPPARLKPTYLNLDTGYDEIDARITLTSPGEPTHTNSPSYITQAKTFNGRMQLTVVHDESCAPMPYQLFVRNNLANTTVILDSKFEGTFMAQSKLGDVNIIGVPADSNGDDGTRTLQYDNSSPSPTAANGQIGREEQTSSGYVEIVSSLGPITLDFDGE